MLEISGYVEKLIELQDVDTTGKSQLIYNVIGDPYSTYMLTGTEGVDKVNLTTDIIKTFPTLAELKGAVSSPKDGDVYLVGSSAPFERYKAFVRGDSVKWEKDGVSDLYIKENHKSQLSLQRKNYPLENGVYYTVGTKAPYDVYGSAKDWQCVGMIISGRNDNLNVLKTVAKEGEVYLCNGDFYMKCKNKLVKLKNDRDFSEAYSQVWKKNGERIVMREGLQLGTYEFVKYKE